MNTQNNTTFENCMNIHLLSFTLPKNILKEKDDVRVSITTMPEERKQHFTIESKKIYSVNHVFSINITEKTDKIIIVFRKKTILSENPIIASATLSLNKFKNVPKEQITNGILTSDVQTLNIYYPLQKQMKEEHCKNIERKVLGQMQVQLSFTVPYIEIEKNKKKKISNENKINKNNNQNDTKSKKIHMKKFGKKNSYDKLSEENDYLI
mgnify:FL=1